MFKRFLPDDLASALRANAIGIAFFVGACAIFLAASIFVLKTLNADYSVMSSSSWVSPVAQLRGGHQYEPGHRYDPSDKGVRIPPAREDRTGQPDGKNAVGDTDYYRRDCYDQAYTLEESDLCAQWSNAAAVRYGNRIALESFWLNSWIGFITAFGVLMAAIGVVLAGLASIAASRSVSMMAYGFMPTLAFSIQKGKAGWIRLVIRNAGTGPAGDIRVAINGVSVRLQQDRLGVDAHMVVEHLVVGDEVEVRADCLDLARKRRSFSRRFIKSGSEWLLAEYQPEDE